MFRLSVVSAAVVLDWIFGEPEKLRHPVCRMGSLIAWMEKKLRRWIPGKEMAGGVFLAVTVPLISVCIPGMILWIASLLEQYFAGNGFSWILGEKRGVISWGLETFWCFQLLAAKSLYQESGKVRKELALGDIEKARFWVSRIVGRDTENLDKQGIARAAVETVAENTSDGVIAPLLFMVLFGALGGFFYKAVNTMDSMVGYKNERYRLFGRAAAKLDDFCNFLPARNSGCLLCAAAGWIGLWDKTFDGKNAWKVFLRDRRKHESPNSAHGEAACAGALRIRLAGDAWYFGELHKKPWIGDALREIEAEDVRRAGKLMLGAEVLGVVLCWVVFCF